MNVIVQPKSSALAPVPGAAPRIVLLGSIAIWDRGRPLRLPMDAQRLVAFLAFFTTTFHVTAKTVTEGLIQRTAVAPFDGYIATAPAKAGDVVTAGRQRF